MFVSKKNERKKNHPQTIKQTQTHNLEEANLDVDVSDVLEMKRVGNTHLRLNTIIHRVDVCLEHAHALVRQLGGIANGNVFLVVGGGKKTHTIKQQSKTRDNNKNRQDKI